MTDTANTIRQSAVLPYRWRNGRLEVLLITSRDSGRWVVPKGHVAPDMEPRESAVKEAHEEAGISGKVAKNSIGRYFYRKADLKRRVICAVDLFPMQVTRIDADWPEKADRRRQWMALDAAAECVAEAKLRELIMALAESAAPDP